MLSNAKYQKAIKELDAIHDVQCDCDFCKQMCHGFTCRPTPKEAKLLIQNGYGNKLTCQRGHVDIDDTPVYLSVLKPASVGSESQFSGIYKRGTCVMLDTNGHCILHGTPMKPAEGRKVSCSVTTTSVYELVEKTWDSKEGNRLVEHWTKNYTAR